MFRSKQLSIAKQIVVLFAIVSACYLCCLVEGMEVRPDGRLSDCPRLMLWAWERPENLEWIDPKKIGVAFLSRTISLNGNKISVHRRQQSLKIPADTYIMAVVRIESDVLHPATFDDAQVDSVAEKILSANDDRGIRAFQIDFDARKNERSAYAKILAAVRRGLPSSMPLTMTSLASWCASDYWLDSLPVDEAVPMMFRMGILEKNKSQYLKYMTSQSSPSVSRGPTVPSVQHHKQKCASSIGFSTDELSTADAANFSNRRVYLFSPHPWSPNQSVAISHVMRSQ